MRVRYQMRNVDVREAGRGPAVVLVHGYPLDGDMWESVSQILSRRFRVLRPDLPARRDTPRAPEPTMKAYAAWLAAVVEACGAPAGVAGFSMGGYVLFEYLKQKPAFVTAAAFVDTQAGADDEAGRAARAAAIFTAREMGPGFISERIIPRLLSAAALKDRELVERVSTIVRRQSPNSIEGDLLAMRDRTDSISFLPEIKIPSLVLAGSEDRLTPPAKSEVIAKGIPGARLVTIPGAGHLTPMEKPDEVAAAIEAFFGAHLSQAA